MGIMENLVHSESLRTVTSLNGSQSEGRVGNIAKENGDYSFHTGPPKYKRRKVSAVRDFPLGCGPFAPRILSPGVTVVPMLEQKNVLTSEEEKGVVSSDQGNGIESVDAEPAKALSPAPPSLNNAGLSEHVKGLEDATLDFCKIVVEQENVLTSEEEKVVVSSENAYGLESVNAEPVKVQSPASEAVNDAGFSEHAKGLEDIAIDLSKDLCLVYASSLKEKMILPSSFKSSSPSDVPSGVPKGNGLQKTVAKQYPPRRKVSAIRHFPPLCGRNMPHLCKEDNLKVLASPKRKSLGQGKSDIGESPFEDTNETDVKQMGEDVQNEDAQKSILQGSFSMAARDKVGAEPDQRGKKERESMEPVVDTVVVLGLMAAPNCPWRMGKGANKPYPTSATSESKGKKYNFLQRGKYKSAVKTKDGLKDSGATPIKKNSYITGNGVSQGMGQIVIWDKNYSPEDDERREDFLVAPRLRNVGVNLPPIGQNVSCKGHNTDTVTRGKVRETLRLFQAVCRKLLQHEEEAKSKEPGNALKRIDYKAARILKEKDKYVNIGKQILGPVPGVEVGDEFHYRVELIIIGLHRQSQGGIDYVKHGGKILATSIVASGGYADDLDNSESLIYTGQGGNVMNAEKKPEDQKLERGNLALKNSMHERNPVRVIRGSDSSDGKTYVYDGLYMVEKCWQDLGPHGKLVFKFQLDRIPGQPELAWKEVRKSKKFKIREGLCLEDISQGKELVPICAVNNIDDEKPPPFKYVTCMIYPDWCHPVSLKGCDCINGCSDSENCLCAVRNGGELPFNYNGAIVEAKPLVYECGPSCKCASSCRNRVSQRGIKFQLEIFKTRSRGWGVRSLNSIPSGSFICEYIGELLEEKEAEQRTGNDEYLFDIGNNYNDSSLWDGLASLIPDALASSCEVVEDGGFTIDAAEYGNVGRFINHSCSPNLYAQNVLHDHEDNRIPHIMFFAAENIPPLQELTYHYNYMLDQVRDENGNIKKKSCYCGSTECTGRMY